MDISTEKITYTTFRQMDFDDPNSHLYELINGEIVKKGAPHIQHQAILGELYSVFKTFVKKQDLGKVYFAPVDVVLSENNAPQPDLFFIKKDRLKIIDEAEGVVMGAPDLAVEIISPGSVRRDRVVKKELYEQFGIAEYWLVDPQNASIEVYILENEHYQLHLLADKGDTVSSKLLEGFTFDTGEIFD